MRKLNWLSIISWLIILTTCSAIWFKVFTILNDKPKHEISRIWFGDQIEQVKRMPDGMYRITSRKNVILVDEKFALKNEVK